MEHVNLRFQDTFLGFSPKSLAFGFSSAKELAACSKLLYQVLVKLSGEMKKSKIEDSHAPQKLCQEAT